MVTITINPQRRDGKFPVTLFFPGAPNMFGGFDFGRHRRKLWTLEEVESVRVAWPTATIENNSSVKV